jgi:hypothetical protein
LKAYCEEVNTTLEALQKQQTAMEQYFANPSSTNTDVEDDLCQIIHGIAVIELWNKQHVNLQPAEISTGYMAMRTQLSLVSGHRIDSSLDTTPETLRTKRDQLLQCLKLPLSEFKKDGVYTARCEDRIKSLPFQELRSLKHQIWMALVTRKAEFQELHRTGLSGSQSSKYLLILRTCCSSWHP